MFFSYAREDREFVIRLDQALQLNAVETRGDWQLVDGESYTEQLDDMQLGADIVVFALSPEALRSAPCRVELDRAVQQRKRILPVVCRDVGSIEDEIPDAVRNPQWTFLRPSDDFVSGVKGLVEAINTDFQLVPEHRRLLQAADSWRRHGGSRSFLLRKEGLASAEVWLTNTGRHPDKLPKPTALQLDYIRASSAARSRGTRILLMVVTGITVAMAGLALVAWLQRNDAIEQRKIADDQRALAEQRLRVATARELAGRARDQFGDAQLSLLVALHAAYETHVSDRTVTPEAQEALQWALQWLGGEPDFAHDWVPAAGKLVLSPDGRRLVMVGDPSIVFALHVDEVAGQGKPGHTELFKLRGRAPEATVASFSPDGRTIVTGGIDGTTTVWDGANGNELGRLVGHRGAVLTLAFSDDGRLLATGGADGTARTWSVASRRPEHTVLTQDGNVRTVALTSNGTLLATGGDSAVKIWDIASKRLLRSLPQGGPVTHVTFHPDGSQVAAAGGIMAHIWEATSGRLVSRLSGHVAGVNAVAFRPSVPSSVATASGDGTVRLWNVASGNVLLNLSVGVGEPMVDVRFSRDGNYLLTTGQNLRLYPVGVDELLRVARRFVKRSLTVQECVKYLQQSPCPALPSLSSSSVTTEPSSQYRFR